MSQQELAQHYVVEIAARARTVRSRCVRLLEDEYFSEAPPAFTRTIRSISEYLASATVAIYGEIDWAAPPEEIELDLTLLRTTDQFIKVVAEQLRYVEAARTERLPWSIVASFEKLVAAFLPDIQIMLRAMWRYNYAFHMVDLADVYRRYLEPYREYVPDVDLDAVVLADMQRPFHIISFPSLEQKHILLHCLLGHEIGHLLVGRFLTKARQLTFVEKIRAEVATIVDDDLKTLPAGVDDDLRKSIREQTIGNFLQETLNQWQRAVEELLSDAAGIFLFGPAALLSTLDLAIQNSLDETPEASTNYYPPWRMRLRHTLQLLDDQGGWFPVPTSLFRGDADRAERVNNRVALIRSMVASNSDRLEINKSRLAQIAYREVDDVIKEGHTFLLEAEKLTEHRPNAKVVYDNLPVLIERLDQLIPPNAFEQTLADTRVATFAEILNASWLHKVSLSPFDKETGQLDPNAVEARNLMNNLTLKAIEFAHLATEYGQWKPPK